MKTVTKALAAASVIAAVAGISLIAEAQTPAAASGQTSGPAIYDCMWGPHTYRFADPSAQLAALKTYLGIRPEQQTAWDAYAQTVQDTAAQMRATYQTTNWGWGHMGMHRQYWQARTRLQAAAQTLLPALDDTQKAAAGNGLPGLTAYGPMMGHGSLGMMGGPMWHGGW
jgi:hypothetical protein